MKKLMSESLSLYTCELTDPSLAGSDSLFQAKLKKLFAGKYADSLLSKVQLSVQKIGGPPENNAYLQWKLALLTDNSTWSVTDRGTAFVPVWDIIASAHDQDFNDLRRLRKTLEDIYTKTTQTKTILSGDNLQSAAGLSESHTVTMEKPATFLQMLETVGLSEYYPQKMKKGDVLVIDSLMENSHELKREDQLGLDYICQLMMLDCNARYIGTKSSDAVSVKQCSSGDSVDDFLNIESDSTEEDENQGIHPMDIHIAVFLCADDFLRQYICTKLAMCQFALPLLVPDPGTGEVEFPLWALRQVRKSWRCRQESADTAVQRYDDQLMSSTPAPIISFIRLGSSSQSKSQILNNVISKQKHDVFFHRHCRGSTPSRLLMDGVVEVSWYLPGGRRDDTFDSCVAFVNLHGDASKHPRQLQFLQEVSTVNVVLLSENGLDEEAKRIFKALFDSPVPLICLFTGTEKISPGPNKAKVRLAVKNKNEALLSDEITHHIKQCVNHQLKENREPQKNSPEKCLGAGKKHFKVDEEKDACQLGHSHAQVLMKLLGQNQNEPPISKRTCFPLQGDLWKEWCRLDKKQNRLQCRSSENMEQELCDIKAKKDKMRQKQLESVSQSTGLMQFFLDCLCYFSFSQDTKLYMLHWLTICLQEREKVFKTVDVQTEKEFHIKLHDFMREAAQMYEAAQISSISQQRERAGALPAIAAEMLILGYPLELMDGETAHVPLEWIKSVLDKLITELGDKKVFVLSVLGLQSSGKSTLLNTMFGLQFAVSAGRCTRGAFMQLLTVDAEMREQLQYDLILVVDTEGLRSLECSDMVHHDNELATFVIGISDLTLVNIMGECSSEMQDILQICVHAFLRMKQVRITPSLIFVHQNMADVSAYDKNMEAKRCLLERLDEMARIAAKKESYKVTGFNDIIQFDVDTQVFYFKNLLQGDPPMAPPNPTYSHNTQELKAKLLSIAQWKPDHRFSTLTAFKFRIQDLWQALLAENFVFSFTNTLETSVKLALEEKCVEWTWRIRKHALEIQNGLTMQIVNNLVQEVDPDQINQKLDPVCRSISTEMENYFRTEKHSDILAQYEQATEKWLQNLRVDVAGEIKSSCMDSISLAKGRAELDIKKREYEAKLLEMSKALASKLKDKNLSSETMRRKFDKLWQKWMEDIPKDAISWKNGNVIGRVDDILQGTFKHVSKIGERIKIGTPNFQLNRTDHIYSGWTDRIHRSLTLSSGSSPDEIVNKLTYKIQVDIHEYIESKEKKKLDFNPSFIPEILDKIRKHISEAKKTFPQITENYTVDLSISLCTLAAERFQKMHDEFKKANDPITVLQSQRKEYWQIFEKFCQGATSTMFCVDILCKKLKPAFERVLSDKFNVQMTDLLKNNCTEFKSKSSLETHIMRHLAEAENFDSFMEYLHNPRVPRTWAPVEWYLDIGLLGWEDSQQTH
ncbi:interferon-induced very large GTPase 1-like [Megalops cyprinoides]|uniref:interferon-induced very large GTPase 1-like n=1 Tax=Megalops cyprinoides TaxID=118141 RepID=UPI001864CB18|nr:interferon-induced very large GTPase 1-like [Megalops cyprinoides]